MLRQGLVGLDWMLRYGFIGLDRMLRCGFLGLDWRLRYGLFGRLGIHHYSKAGGHVRHIWIVLDLHLHIKETSTSLGFSPLFITTKELVEEEEAFF
jgi:hypothetical protein